MNARCALVLVVLAVSLGIATPARAVAEWPKVTLASLTVTDLVGDPVLAPAHAESLFRRVLAREEFMHLQDPGHYGNWEGYRVANPLRGGSDAAGPAVTIDVAVELEQARYETTERSPILGAPTATVPSAVPQVRDHAGTLAVMQCRMTVTAAGHPAFTCVVEGDMPGMLEEMSKRTGIERATRLALMELGCKLTTQLGKTLALPVRKPQADRPKEQFLAEIDSY